MKKLRVVVPDWAVGSGITAILLVLFLLQFGPLETIEAKIYNLRARLRNARSSDSRWRA